MKKMVALCLFAISFSAFSATNLDGFDKRFKMVRENDGTLKGIKMKTFTKSFSIKPFVEKIRDDIKEEIRRLNSKSFAAQSEIDELISMLEQTADTVMGLQASDELDENLRYTREALERLPEAKVDESFETITSSEVLEKFELDLKDLLFKFDLAVIAAPMDAKYFYRRHVTYEVVTRALEFAKKKFSSVPVLNLASYIIVRVHDLILEQRLYHQYMLMGYLENIDAKTLGMTKEEADRVYSSLFEAQIAPINFRESKIAAETWARYGVDKFFVLLRGANNKLRRMGPMFDSVNSRYNFAFVEVVEEGQRVVKNLLVNTHTFSSKMSTAYVYDKPNKVKRTRMLIQLGQVGLGFLPIPGWIKNQVDAFLGSYYTQQTRTEGALMGYFEMTGNAQMTKEIYKQANNPYLIY